VNVKKVAAVIAAVLVLLAGGIYLFLARPWSQYSLLEMNSLFAASKRVSNFRHMDQIFPAEPIAGAPRRSEFRRRERPLRVRYRFGGEERNLGGFLRRVSATGLLVVKDGRIVHERYLQGGAPGSRFTSWSMAKSFVATLVGQALAEGRIESLEDLIGDYVPELAGGAYGSVPIRHVLQMSSGIDFDETYDSRFSDINLFFLKLFVLGRSAGSVIGDYDSAGPSGREFHYASIDTQALGMLVSAVYGRPLTEVLEERLWHRLGGASAYWNIDDTDGSGTPIAFCCLNARLRDYARLGQLYLQQGRWRGERLLPAGWVRRATTPGAPFLQPGALPERYGSRGYQYQWWVPKGSRREYFAAGIWGQYIYVSEPDGVVIVRTAADPDYREHGEESIAVFRAIGDALNP